MFPHLCIFITFFFCCCYSQCTFETLNDTTYLFPFGPKLRDYQVSIGDDLVSSSIILPSSVIYYGVFQRTIYVSTNGLISFGSAVSAFVPNAFPGGIPVIAPAWGDADTRSIGRVYYGFRNVSESLEFKQLEESLKVQLNQPTWIFVATWCGVGAYSFHTVPNTFQAILFNIDGLAYVLFAYPPSALRWITADTHTVVPLQAGIDSGLCSFVELPGSRTNQVSNLKGYYAFSASDSENFESDEFSVENVGSKVIPSCSLEELVIPFSVNSNITLISLEIGLKLYFPFSANLNAYLITPNGTSYTLLQNNTCIQLNSKISSHGESECPPVVNSYNNALKSYVYHLTSVDSLESLSGLSFNGIWKLKLCNNDDFTGYYQSSKLFASEYVKMKKEVISLESGAFACPDLSTEGPWTIQLLSTGIIQNNTIVSPDCDGLILKVIEVNNNQVTVQNGDLADVFEVLKISRLLNDDTQVKRSINFNLIDRTWSKEFSESSDGITYSVTPSLGISVNVFLDINLQLSLTKPIEKFELIFEVGLERSITFKISSGVALSLSKIIPLLSISTPSVKPVVWLPFLTFKVELRGSLKLDASATGEMSLSMGTRFVDKYRAGMLIYDGIQYIWSPSEVVRSVSPPSFENTCEAKAQASILLEVISKISNREGPEITISPYFKATITSPDPTMKCCNDESSAVSLFVGIEGTAVLQLKILTFNTNKQSSDEAVGISLLRSIVEGFQNSIRKEISLFSVEKEVRRFCLLSLPICERNTKCDTDKPDLPCSEYSEDGNFDYSGGVKGCNCAPLGAGEVFGDPHMLTLDRASFTFNGEGLFYLLNTNRLSIQVLFLRQGSTTTYIKGVAFKENSVVVTIYNSVHGLDGVYINGAPVTIFPVNYGGMLFESISTGYRITLNSTGTVIVAKRARLTIALQVILGNIFWKQTQGLLGTWDGNSTNDFVVRYSNVTLPRNPSHEEIYAWGWSWNVSSTESLIDTVKKDCFYSKTINNPSFIPVFSANISNTSTACSLVLPELRRLCLFDVALLGEQESSIHVTIGQSIQNFLNTTKFPPLFLRTIPFIEVQAGHVYSIILSGRTYDGTGNVSFSFMGPSFCILSNNNLEINVPLKGVDEFSVVITIKDDQTFVENNVTRTLKVIGNGSTFIGLSNLVVLMVLLVQAFI